MSVQTVSRSLAATQEIEYFLSLPQDTKMFQFSWYSFVQLCIHYTIPAEAGGFPHSEISGSKLVCSSPKHIGAYPVFHRLLVPRHPPYALNNLTLTIICICIYKIIKTLRIYNSRLTKLYLFLPTIKLLLSNLIKTYLLSSYSLEI